MVHPDPVWTFVVDLSSVPTESYFLRGWVPLFPVHTNSVTSQAPQINFPKHIVCFIFISFVSYSVSKVVFLILCYSLDCLSPSLSVYLLLWRIWSPQPLIGIIPSFEFYTIQLFCLILNVSVLSTWESSSLYSAWYLFFSYFHGIIASQYHFFPMHTWYAGDSYLLSNDNHWPGVLAGLGLSVQARAASVSQTLACIWITSKTCWNWFLGLTASN